MNIQISSHEEILKDFLNNLNKNGIMSKMKQFENLNEEFMKDKFLYLITDPSETKVEKATLLTDATRKEDTRMTNNTANLSEMVDKLCKAGMDKKLFETIKNMYDQLPTKTFETLVSMINRDIEYRKKNKLSGARKIVVNIDNIPTEIIVYAYSVNPFKYLIVLESDTRLSIISFTHYINAKRVAVYGHLDLGEFGSAKIDYVFQDKDIKDFINAAPAPRKDVMVVQEIFTKLYDAYEKILNDRNN